MSRKHLILVYCFFFFMYFFGFDLMGNSNAGLSIPWNKMFGPLDLSYYLYTILTVLLAHFLIFRKYFYAKPRWKLWAAILALLVFFILFRYTLEEIIYPRLIGHGNYNPKTTFRYYAVDNIYYGLVRIFIGFVLFLLDDSFRQQKKQALLTEQTRQAELNFLQAQMNPHFLFNSLNNIYSLAYEKHPAAAEAVLTLSDMMRYVTYQKETAVQLEKEAEYVQNMIRLQQLRFDYKLQYLIEINMDTLPCRILPLLLVTLVENALKHGDLSDPALPLRILCERKEGQLNLVVSNKIMSAPVPDEGGIGLNNLRRRLELSYPTGGFSFTTSQKNNIFSAHLTLPFN